MEPNQFRETRLKINQLCDDVELFADKSDADASKDALEKANELLTALTPEAAGEIQERSVRNLGLKIKVAKTLIKKIKPKKAASRKTGPAVPKEYIDWTVDRLETLSANYLSRVFANMDSSNETGVYFSAVGKGVRPSYQIELKDGTKTAYSGSGHKPLKRNLPDNGKEISPSFSRSTIESILEQK
jgi:dsDNA-binding SOS-regulon protein